MDSSSPNISFNRCCRFLTALLLISIGWMFCDQSGNALQKVAKEVQSLMPKGQNLTAATKPPPLAISNRVAETPLRSDRLLIDLEEDWETFLAMQPVRNQKNLLPSQSCPGSNPALHQAERARKIYLQHRSFLC